MNLFESLYIFVSNIFIFLAPVCSLVKKDSTFIGSNSLSFTFLARSRATRSWYRSIFHQFLPFRLFFFHPFLLFLVLPSPILKYVDMFQDILQKSTLVHTIMSFPRDLNNRQSDSLIFILFFYSFLFLSKYNYFTWFN